MRMTRTLIAVLVAAASTALSQEQRLGLGVMLGEPTGASVKYMLNEQNALNGGIGWSSVGNNNLHLHTDYLWHNYSLLGGLSDAPLPVYYGLGGRVKFGGDTRLGVRAPIGVSYMIEQLPVDVFVEAGPILDFTPGLRVSFTAAIGARFWF